MSGLRNEATLALKITLSNSKGVASVKKELEALSKAFQAGAFKKEMDTLQKEFLETRKEMRALAAENKTLKKANDQLTKSFSAAVKSAQAQAKAQKQVGQTQQSSAISAAIMRKAQDTLNAAAARGADFTLKHRMAILKLQQAMDRNVRMKGRASKAVLTYTKQLKLNIDSEEALNRAMTTGMAPLEKKLGLISQLRNAFSEYEHRVDALYRASLRLSMTGMQLQRWGQNIIGGLSDVMDTWETFEYQMVRAAGALEIWHDGINTTEVGYTELTKAIVDASQALVYFSAEETAEALYFWGSATGQVVTELGHLETALGGVGAMMKAATMTNTGFEQTIKGVYSILSQFYNGELEHAEYVTEQLFFTTQKTAAEWMDLVQSFKMLGPVAATAGATFDEVNLIIGKLSDMGLRGSQAGRGLRQFFIQMVRPSGPARAAYEELFNRPENIDRFGGKSLTDIMFPEGDYIGITTHIMKLAEATLHMESAERLAFLAKVSTANQLPVVTSLVAEARQEIRGLADDFDKFEDAASPAEVFEQNWAGFQTTWGYVVKNVERGIEQIKLSMGILLKDVFTPLMEMLRGLTDQIVRFVETNPDLVRLAGSFAAIAAAALIAGGVLFTALGALLALGASIYLVWGATQKWHAVIVGTTAALFFMAEAVFDNARYIGEALSEAIENFNKAIKNMGVGLEDVGGLFEALTRPAREIAGFIVRLASDIAVVASEFAVWASEIPIVTDALNVLVQLITILVSAKMVAGVFRLVAGFKALNVAIATNLLFSAGFVGKLKAIGTAVKLLGSARGFASIAVGIRLVGSAIAAVLGGPLGVIALATTLAFIAYETVGPFRDFVDGVIGAFSDASSELDKMVDKFGSGGEAIRDKILSRLDVADDIKQAATDTAVAVQQYNDFVDDQMDPDGGGPRMEDYAHIEDYQERQAAFWRDFEAYRDKAFAVEANAAASHSRQGSLENAAAKMVKRDIDIILGVYEQSDALRGQFETKDIFGTFVNNLWDDLESGALQPINGAHRVNQLANIISGMARNTPELTQDEAFDLWQTLTGIDPLFMGLTFSEFLNNMAIAGMQIVEQSAIMDEDVIAALDKALTLTDPTAIAEALTTPFAALDGLTIADILGTGEFSQYHPLARQVMEWHAEKEAEALEQGSASFDVYKARIKQAAEAVAVDLAMAGIPNLDDITLTLQSLSIEGTPESRAKMAALLLEPIYPDGPTFLEAAKQFGLTDAAKLAKTLSDAGVGSPELEAALATESAKAGEAAGETSKENFQEGWLSALSEIGKFDPSDIKAAIKRGNAGDILEKAMRNSVKARKIGHGKGATPESRQMANAIFDQEINVVVSTFQTRVRRGKTKNAEKWGKDYITSILPDYKNLPKNQKKKVDAFMRKYANRYPIAFRIAVNSIKDGDGANRLINRILGGGKDGDGGGAGGDAVADQIAEMLTPALETVASSEEVAGSASLIGTGVADSFKSGASEAFATMGWTAEMQNVAANLKQAENSGRFVQSAGTGVAASFLQGLSSGITTGSGTVGVSVAIMLGAVAGAVDGRAWGRNIGTEFVQGVEEGITTTTISVTGSFTSYLESNSPPKKGPLRNINKWGQNLGEEYKAGFAKGISKNSAPLNRELANFTGRDVDLNAKKEVVVKLEVTSPDGTVNRQKQADVRRGALEAITAAGLSHYVTVG